MDHHHLSPSVIGLLRGMLPDGWDYVEGTDYGIRCDGIMLRSSPQLASSNNSNDDVGPLLRLIPANKSIKISSLNPIMNIIKGNKESEKTSVYYFEVFVISGTCAVGFVPAALDDNNNATSSNDSHHHRRRRRADAIDTSSSVAVGTCGHLIHHPDAEFPLLQNNSEQNGETIGCGIIFGTANLFLYT